MKVLILGGGSIGRRHLGNWRALRPGDELCVRKRAPDAAFSEEHQCRVVTSDAEEVAFDPDVVIVATPTSLHADGYARARALDAHCFMEKPLVRERASLERVRGFGESPTGRAFYIGFMLRFHPLITRVKHILDTGEFGLGKPYHARLSFGSYLPNWHPYEDYRTSYASRAELGGGVIATITHELDLVQWLFGDPVQVTCRTGNTNRLAIEVEEQCEAIFEYDDLLVSLHLDYLQKRYDRNVVILCDEGRITWDWHGERLLIEHAGGADHVVEAPEGYAVNELYLDELRDFIRVIEGEPAARELDLAHAVANTDLMLAMYASAAEGRTVAVDHEKQS